MDQRRVDLVAALLILMMLVIPLIFLGIGLLWEKHPPKEINWVYGYRTRRSSASQQAWDFAHAYFAKLARRLGMIMRCHYCGRCCGAGRRVL